MWEYLFHVLRRMMWKHVNVWHQNNVGVGNNEAVCLQLLSSRAVQSGTLISTFSCFSLSWWTRFELLFEACNSRCLCIFHWKYWKCSNWLAFKTQQTLLKCCLLLVCPQRVTPGSVLQSVVIVFSCILKALWLSVLWAHHASFYQTLRNDTSLTCELWQDGGRLQKTDFLTCLCCYLCTQITLALFAHILKHSSASSENNGGLWAINRH